MRRQIRQQKYLKTTTYLSILDLLLDLQLSSKQNKHLSYNSRNVASVIVPALNNIKPISQADFLHNNGKWDFLKIKLGK